MNKIIKVCLIFILSTGAVKAQGLPEGFVYLDEVIPDILYDIRYAGNHNFIGKPITGYEEAQAILSKPAAEALAKVQQELIQKDFMLKIFDAYRPQRAVNHFMEWAM